MRAQTLKYRVDSLEQRVENLEQLPGRVTSRECEISQFQQGVRVEFSTLRGEMTGFREEMTGFCTSVSAEFVQVRTEMRVLHEEVISRIALLDEGLNGNRRRRGQPTSPLWTPALDRHQAIFGRAPDLAGDDRGFSSAPNEQAATDRGVRRVILPRRGPKSPARRAYERQRWFRRGVLGLSRGDSVARRTTSSCAPSAPAVNRLFGARDDAPDRHWALPQ